MKLKRQYFRRALLSITTLILLVIASGSIFELIDRSRNDKIYPPPGRMIDIGGRRIQIDCRGTGSPTVVFESALDTNGSLAWSPIIKPVSQYTRACAYSRAGIMWSDPRVGPTSAKGIAEDLHLALERAGETGPFVLVGHSLGGPYVMTYTKYFDTEVAGLVLVDASHPDQVTRLSKLLPDSGAAIFRIASALSWSGIVRIAAPFMLPQASNQSDHDISAIRSYASTSVGAFLSERDSLDSTLAEAGTIRQLGNRPLYVLTALAPFSQSDLNAMKVSREQGGRIKSAWREMQDDEASWSTRSQHEVLYKSNHYIQFDDPGAVVKAITVVVNQVREDTARGPKLVPR